MPGTCRCSLPGTGQRQTGLLTLGGLAFFLTIIPLTYIMLFVTERLRGGVWAGIAAHTGFNLMDALMANGGAGALLEAMIMIAVAVVLGLVWRLTTPRVRAHVTVPSPERISPSGP